MKRKKSFYLILFLILFFLSACNARLSNLKALAKNRALTGKYVLKQEGLFQKLVQDIKEGKITKGMPKDKILSLYSDAIYTKYVDKDNDKFDMWFYRMPVDYFTSDKVYLYFDSTDRLASWEYKEYKKD